MEAISLFSDRPIFLAARLVRDSLRRPQAGTWLTACVQGYYFAKPASAQKAEAVIQEKEDLQRAFAVLHGTNGDPAVPLRAGQIVKRPQSLDQTRNITVIGR